MKVLYYLTILIIIILMPLIQCSSTIIIALLESMYNVNSLLYMISIETMLTHALSYNTTETCTIYRYQHAITIG